VAPAPPSLPTNTNLRWTIVARWTVLFAAVAIVVDLAARIFGGGRP
jgi:hypothetical protein